MLDSKPHLFPTGFPQLKRDGVTTLQVNLGLKCNQGCNHCHVAAGPSRTEMMSEETLDSVIDCLNRVDSINTLDITGGAPELHDGFRRLIRAARDLGKQVIDRCNLTILSEPDQKGLAEFLADQQVQVVASMPCYLQENVESQRGKGVYDKSIAGLQKLNALGYGHDESGLILNLVYNPGGAYLPPSQCELEQAYRQRLKDDFGIVFNALFTITNMPISRFGSMLLSKGKFPAYMDLLRDSFQPDNLQTVMCRELISVSWQGYLYDCDFNQMLDLKMSNEAQYKLTIKDLPHLAVQQWPIIVAEHCYGCTAGQGSSCSGALV